MEVRYIRTAFISLSEMKRKMEGGREGVVFGEADTKWKGKKTQRKKGAKASPTWQYTYIHRREKCLEERMSERRNTIPPLSPSSVCHHLSRFTLAVKY